MTVGFRIESLRPEHDRSGFACGVEALDRYLREQATQDIRRRASSCFVAVAQDDGRIAGYYTLAASGVPLTELPEALAKKLPRYPSVPIARVGRLAVAQAFAGRKLGAALLADAALRAARSDVAVFALAVDAKDDAAEAFYRHHGFVAFGPRPRQLLLPLASLTKRG